MRKFIVQPPTKLEHGSGEYLQNGTDAIKWRENTVTPKQLP
jgi:hypothetical protein